MGDMKYLKKVYSNPCLTAKYQKTAQQSGFYFSIHEKSTNYFTLFRMFTALSSSKKFLEKSHFSIDNPIKVGYTVIVGCDTPT